MWQAEVGTGFAHARMSRNLSFPENTPFAVGNRLNAPPGRAGLTSSDYADFERVTDKSATWTAIEDPRMAAKERKERRDTTQIFAFFVFFHGDGCVFHPTHPSVDAIDQDWV